MVAAVPPLVAPGAELTRDEIERYSRHVILPEVGEMGQRRLRNARVAVVGAGGLGSPALTYLAAAGVGTIGIVDFDVVEISNLQRQTIHGVADLGRPKTVSAAAAIAQINPLVSVVQHPLRLSADNALATLAGYDLVIDGTDNFATRYLINDACVLLGVPYVWGSVFRFEGQASVFWAAHGPHYRELYPTPPPAGSVMSCGEGGVLGVLCAAIGAVMATEAVKLICGIGKPLIGRLLTYDALAMSVRTIDVRRDPAVEPITGLIDYEAFCGSPPATAPTDRASVTPGELSELLVRNRRVTLIDVRDQAEFELGSLPGAHLIPLVDITTGRALDTLRAAAAAGQVVLYCKSGSRSARALEALQASGLENIVELHGGILAWGNDIDPSLPRY